MTAATGESSIQNINVWSVKTDASLKGLKKTCVCSNIWATAAASNAKAEKPQIKSIAVHTYFQTFVYVRIRMSVCVYTSASEKQNLSQDSMLADMVTLMIQAAEHFISDMYENIQHLW